MTEGYVIELASRQLHGWRLFGVWTDSETGIQYIDPVRHVDALQDALALARENGELAIWSLREEREIRL